MGGCVAEGILIAPDEEEAAFERLVSPGQYVFQSTTFVADRGQGGGYLRRAACTPMTLCALVAIYVLIPSFGSLSCSLDRWRFPTRFRSLMECHL